MKKLFTILLLLTPFILKAQHYTITLAELQTGVITKNGNSIDMNTTGWEKEAYIEFTGLKKNDLEQIDVKQHSNELADDIVESQPQDMGGSYNINYGLKVSMEKHNEFVFDIWYLSKKIGTCRFTLTQKGGAVAAAAVPEATKGVTIENYLGILASANFVGNSKFLSNLTPVVNFGAQSTIAKSAKGGFSWVIEANPYLGAQIDTKDTSALLPALMLYGRAGAAINNYMNFYTGNNNNLQLMVMPLGVGLKFIDNMRDSGNVVVQHNLRFGLGMRYGSLFSLSGQLTHGWHNLTSASDGNFGKVFPAQKATITYATVVAQLSFKGTGAETMVNYLFFEWRGLLNKSNFQGYNNSRFLTIGFRKTLDLNSSTVFSAGSSSRSRPAKRNIHNSL